MEALDHSVVEQPKKMLTVNPLPGGGWHVEINPSSLSLLQSCPRKSKYTLHQGLVSLNRADALTAGTAVHRALEILYSAPFEERRLLPNYKKKIERMCGGEVLDDESTGLIYRATRGLINSASSLAYLEPGEARSIPNLGWLFGEYLETRIRDPWETIAVEKLYSTIIVDEPKLKITLFGTIDAIFKDINTKQLFVTDHKTAARIDSSLYNKTKPNHQFTAYILLAQRRLGLDVDNFMMNCFEVKAKPKTARGRGPNFLTIPTSRSEEDIEEFIQTATYYVTQYLSWIDNDYFPLGPVSACSNFGKCSYLDVCSSPEIIKESILTSNYKVAKYEEVK